MRKKNKKVINYFMKWWDSYLKSINFFFFIVHFLFGFEVKRWNRMLKYKIYYVCTNPFAWAGCDTRSIFKWRLTGLNSDSSFSQSSCHAKVNEPSLLFYLFTDLERIVEFLPFLRALASWEMQTALSRIWTQITVSIS